MKTNVTVRIMDSDYQLLCEVEEKEILIRSAEILSQTLKSFRRENPAIDIEKLLVMGALRSTVELVTEIDALSVQVKAANAEMERTLAYLESDD